ncbi:potassium channel family protein [Aquisphaera insulae]|uniref:potassium channel family protein n=1 Tax=Aquisphaera insulae TaxID=2712864 RepID=UPI0013EAC946|nr:NAD-binding protein [Aquisphaera insulae]
MMLPHLRIPARLRVYARFNRYLLWEFRWALGVFASLVVGGGLLLHTCYHHEPLSFPRACHAVFLMIFLESSIEFPDEWYLQPLFFLIPIVGLGAIADSVIRLAFLMFSRKQNQPEWNRMLASLCRDHFVVVGVGMVGYQVIRDLLEIRESVVAIDKATDDPLLTDLFDRGIPVILGNARMETILEQANVAQAKAIILTTADDLTNMDIALTARDMNPTARIVLRLFDETLAAKVVGAFAMPVISTSRVAAPAFIAEAMGRKVYHPFQLSGKSVHLTDLVVSEDGGLVDLTVGDLQGDKIVNVVMHQGRSGVQVNPNNDIVLSPGDTILVIAPMEPLLRLESLNRPGAGGRN